MSKNIGYFAHLDLRGVTIKYKYLDQISGF